MKIKYDSSFSSEKEIKKNYGDVWNKIIRLIDDIKLAENIEELRKKRNHLHELLEGDRKGQLSLKITGNQRLIFQPNNDDPEQENFLKDDGGYDLSKIKSVILVEVIDYH